MNEVQDTDALGLLSSLDEGSVDAIITSPPFSGLPDRDDTLVLVEEMAAAAQSALHPDRGTLTMIVGPSPGSPFLQADVAKLVPYATDGGLELHSALVWDRTGTLQRPVDGQMISHDFILHFTRPDADAPQLLPTSSVISTKERGFDYGRGVTTPPDLAAWLIANVSRPGDLVVDPFAGLGEIGVQATHQGRRFVGSDINSACVAISNDRLRNTLPVHA